MWLTIILMLLLYFLSNVYLQICQKVKIVNLVHKTWCKLTTFSEQYAVVLVFILMLIKVMLPLLLVGQIYFYLFCF